MKFSCLRVAPEQLGMRSRRNYSKKPIDIDAHFCMMISFLGNSAQK